METNRWPDASAEEPLREHLPPQCKTAAPQGRPHEQIVQPLAGFLVHSVRVAARAVLVHLKTIWVVTTVLLGDVVALFALLARQGDLGADVALGHGSAFLRCGSCINGLVVRIVLFGRAGRTCSGGRT